MAGNESHLTMRTEEEDRLLRVWTPIILRASVLTASVILSLGLAAIAIVNPNGYVQRFHLLQQTGSFRHVEFSHLSSPEDRVRAVLVFGLLVLTLVPLGRVAFTFFYFLKERDTPFILVTATVLALLIAGVLLGRAG